jgi:hypothetical protein
MVLAKVILFEFLIYPNILKSFGNLSIPKDINLKAIRSATVYAIEVVIVGELWVSIF